MRSTVTLTFLLLLPSVGDSQTKKMIDDAAARLESVRYVASLHDPASGGFRPDPMGKPSLRATNAAARAWKYLGGDGLGEKFPDREKAAAFVMQCFDPKTGGFADAPGGTPNVSSTAVGVMAAVEFHVSKEKFVKAMSYIHEKAKSFEDVRIGAAAVEAWGVKDCPFPLDDWFKVVELISARGDAVDGVQVGSMTAMLLRLGKEAPRKRVVKVMNDSQRADGGWGKKGAASSDLDSTYRVMRTYYLLKQKPKDTAKLREFLSRCRNENGGYGVSPGKPSGIGGVYYASIITHWLHELEKK